MLGDWFRLNRQQANHQRLAFLSPQGGREGIFQRQIQKITPPKFNIAPENGGLEWKTTFLLGR